VNAIVQETETAGLNGQWAMARLDEK